MTVVTFIMLCFAASTMSFRVQDSIPSFRLYSEADSKGVSIQSSNFQPGVHMRDATNELHALSFNLSQGTVGVSVEKRGLRGHMSVRPAAGMTVTDDDRQFLLDYVRLAETGKHKNARVGLLAKLAEWLAEAPNNHVLIDMDIELAPIRGNGGAPKLNSHGRRLATITSPACGCPGGAACPAWLMASDSPTIGCPTLSSIPEADEGATCMCPYSSTTPRTANYDNDIDGTVWSWNRKFGSTSTDCRGRCGKGCNSLDKEAFKDCFDHDSCVDHFGGSVTNDSPTCGDEFNNAADDYVVSYGWSCC